MSGQIATIDISPLLAQGLFLVSVCLAEIAESAERFSPDGENFRSHRTDAGASGEPSLLELSRATRRKTKSKHGKHRKFYSLTLINGGLRPWAASQLVCLAEIAERAERFSPDGENLGHTDYTDYTDYACLAASGISLLIPQKAKVKYRKKQK
jgi:hypothetical protein